MLFPFFVYSDVCVPVTQNGSSFLWSYSFEIVGLIFKYFSLFLKVIIDSITQIDGICLFFLFRVFTHVVQVDSVLKQAPNLQALCYNQIKL